MSASLSKSPEPVAIVPDCAPQEPASASPVAFCANAAIDEAGSRANGSESPMESGLVPANHARALESCLPAT